MSMSKGFNSGMGCVLGLVAGVVILIVSLKMAVNVVTPCPSCFTSGKCVLCSGTGKGILFGDCMRCDGKKNCWDCGGSGFKWK
jgi:hypothetical protein